MHTYLRSPHHLKSNARNAFVLKNLYTGFVLTILCLAPLLLGSLGCSGGGARSGGSGSVDEDSLDSYADSYNPAKFRYTNSDIGFNLTFNKDWKVYAKYHSMPDQFKPIVKKLKEDGTELIFMGHTFNNLTWVRCTIENTNLKLSSYYKIIREVNAAELTHVSERYVNLGTTNSIEWSYTIIKPEVKLTIRYLEYQVKKDTYNIRLTFWMPDQLFDDLQDPIKRVVSTYQAF